MTGAYLFGKNKEGKKIPIEVEYLTTKERENIFKDKDNKELIAWIELLSNSLKDVSQFLKDEGYTKESEGY